MQHHKGACKGPRPEVAGEILSPCPKNTPPTHYNSTSFAPCSVFPLAFSTLQFLPGYPFLLKLSILSADNSYDVYGCRKKIFAFKKAADKSQIKPDGFLGFVNMWKSF
jgi:hypothetical protein